MNYLTAILVAIIIGAIVYSVLSIIAAFRYLSVRPSLSSADEPISILKPLAGLDDGLESNLRTFFEQNYVQFEILFAAQHEEDPALVVVEKLRKEYSAISSRVIITGATPYPNAKVYSLEKMMAAAKNDLLVMSDSDIRVNDELLATVGAEFHEQTLGVSTCPYRAIPGPTFWSRLEATGMNTDFMSGILVARMLEGMKFAVGPTIVARRKVIESIGGFDRLKDYLAEDFAMGQIAAEAGHNVALSSYVIEHHIGTATFGQSVAHRLRWVRSTRRSRPVGYAGQLFTMPVPLGLLLTAIRPAWWPILAVCVAVRSIAAYAVSRRVLKARLDWRLLPLEDITAFLFWLTGFVGNTVTWRGRKYRVHSDGRFEAVSS